MSLTRILDISGSAMRAQSQRLNAVASNLANAETAAGPDGQAYRAKQVVFQAVPYNNNPAASGVQVKEVREDAAMPRRQYDPRHPLADREGYVTLSNVNPVEEMVNMMSASRAYQTNVETANTAKSLLLKTLQLGQ